MTEETQKAKEVSAMYEAEPIAMPNQTPMNHQNCDRTTQDSTAQTADQGTLSDWDDRVWQAYLASEKQYEEVYRRLADS